MERIAPILVDLYRKIGGLSEPVELIYDPSFSAGDPLEIWETGLERDLAAGRTTLGPHRDGFRFLLSGQEVQKTGSQGQQKTFLVALKMAAHTTLGQSCGIPPLLLLDDIFDKLDENRTRNLLALAGSGTFGQVILTDANPDRALSRLREAGIPYGDIVLGQATRSRP
jgi:DNA replication and repair protein RecF